MANFRFAGLPSFRIWIRVLQRTLLLFCLACLAGCPSATNHRAKEFNEDGVHLFSKGDYRNARDSFDGADVDAERRRPALQPGPMLRPPGGRGRAEQYYVQCLQLDPKHTQRAIPMRPFSIGWAVRPRPTA